MFRLYINPSDNRKFRLVFEPATGGELPPVDVYALTFQDAIHDWWQSGIGEDALPHDIPIELGGSLGGVLTLWIEDDMLTIWDVTEEDDPTLISANELIERRKQERLARKQRTKSK